MIFLIWAACGWAGGYFSTPVEAFRRDPFGIFLLFFAGAICGPFGAALWFLTAKPSDIHFP